MTKEIQPAVLPESLQKSKSNSVGNMRIETPQYVTSDFVYLRPHTNELMVDKCEIIPPNSNKPDKELGLVGLMLVAVTDGDDIITAHVADLRDASIEDFCDGPEAEAPEDPDDMELWTSEIECMLPIAAFIYRDPSDKRTLQPPAGDARFAAAALHLAQLTDRLKKGEKIKIARNTPNDGKIKETKKSAKKSPKK